jgi:hypothetical protein
MLRLAVYKRSRYGLSFFSRQVPKYFPKRHSGIANNRTLKCTHTLR